MNIASIDLGNSLFQAIINGKEYEMPNALALCTKTNVEHYDPTSLEFYENMIVEVDSGALANKREKYYVGISATEKQNVIPSEKNNQKANADRSIILLLSLLGYDSIQENEGQETIKVDFDVVATALPTRQVKRDRDLLKEKLVGHHKVTFRHIPGGSDVTVNIHIKQAIVGIEGAVAHVALTRDLETLKIKDETLAGETVLIADLGGDSLDLIGIRNKKIIDEIEGEIFGINTYLDRIMKDVETNVGYIFPSRYELEKVLAKGPSEWTVVVDQTDKPITDYIEPHLKEMAAQFLTHVDQVRKHVTLQAAKKYFCIGGAVKIAKKYIEEQNDKRQKPMKLTFPENLEKLNLLGLWILAQAQAKKIAAQEVASTKE